MQHETLTQKTIGAAFEVYNALGFGFLESVYERSLCIELIAAGIQIQSQVPIAVTYKNCIVGDFVADLIVGGVVIVELKSVRSLAVAHEMQLVNYLTATGFDVGLLINFGETKVEVKRKVRVLPNSANKASSGDD